MLSATDWKTLADRSAADAVFRTRLGMNPKGVLKELGIAAPDSSGIDSLRLLAKQPALLPAVDMTELHKGIGFDTLCLPGNTGCQTVDWGCS